MLGLPSLPPSFLYPTTLCTRQCARVWGCIGEERCASCPHEAPSVAGKHSIRPPSEGTMADCDKEEEEQRLCVRKDAGPQGDAGAHDVGRGGGGCCRCTPTLKPANCTSIKLEKKKTTKKYKFKKEEKTLIILSLLNKKQNKGP